MNKNSSLCGPKLLKLIFAFVVIAASLFCFKLMPNDPYEINLSHRLAEASETYPLGTDNMGRCVLSRLMAGGKETIIIVAIAAVFMMLIGSICGLLLGFFHGRLHWIGDACLDAFTAFPPIVYLIIFISVWGSGFGTLLLALSLSNVVRVIKLVKSKTAQEKQKAYIQCAIACGSGKTRLMLRHIFPNIAGEILVFMSLLSADMILLISSFSYLGIGMGSGIDWGSMIADARLAASIRPALMLYPAVCIFLSTLAFNLLGEKETDRRA